jgi:hypothetical protein
MKLGIIGSRNFNDYDLLCGVLDPHKDKISLIISGGAKGADLLAEKYADENGIEKLIFLPDWNKHGKSAGFIRNSDIVANSDKILAFWDGTSNGTKNTIEKAENAGKKVKIIYYEEM